MFRFHELIDKNSLELANIIVRENGKNIVEAVADVAKGNETVEWAASLPQMAPGRILEVNNQITTLFRAKLLNLYEGFERNHL